MGCINGCIVKSNLVISLVPYYHLRIPPLEIELFHVCQRCLPAVAAGWANDDAKIILDFFLFCFCSDVFPKMWSDFVGCTKSFGASCISSTELSQFNRAVGNSINSVHKMCTNADYQKGKNI